MLRWQLEPRKNVSHGRRVHHDQGRRRANTVGIDRSGPAKELGEVCHPKPGAEGVVGGQGRHPPFRPRTMLALCAGIVRDRIQSTCWIRSGCLCQGPLATFKKEMQHIIYKSKAKYIYIYILYMCYISSLRIKYRCLFLYYMLFSFFYFLFKVARDPW